MLSGSPPCSPHMPNFNFLFCFLPLITAISTKSETPSSIEINGSIEKILFASDYPLIKMERCLSETEYLNSTEKDHIFGHNAITAYNL